MNFILSCPVQNLNLHPYLKAHRTHPGACALSYHFWKKNINKIKNSNMASQKCIVFSELTLTYSWWSAVKWEVTFNIGAQKGAILIAVEEGMEQEEKGFMSTATKLHVTYYGRRSPFTPAFLSSGKKNKTAVASKSHSDFARFLLDFVRSKDKDFASTITSSEDSNSQQRFVQKNSCKVSEVFFSTWKLFKSLGSWCTNKGTISPGALRPGFVR